MNCADFERTINDLSRNQIMEATARARGLALVETCARCAARLADERVLTQGLRSLAATSQLVATPAHIEAALVAAFRERDKVALLKPAMRPPARFVARPNWRWAIGLAAAVALLFIAFAAIRLQPSRQLPQQLVTARNPQPLKITTDVSAPNQSSPDPVSSGLMDVLQAQLASMRTSGRRRSSLENINRAGNSIRSPQPVNATASNSTASDTATDFIPLTYEASQGAMDGGHVVRVELPRTALAQFGLPVNAERTAESVTADVLLGDDGLARAIRFVR
ncbi:MAG: hypothetical protein H0X14_11540 [Acidobacteria bacterium]|nr:hypothetical protein [Acidobacteriota bacterium]